MNVLNCTAMHASGLHRSMQWHTGLHKAPVFDRGAPVVYQWEKPDGDLLDDVPQLGRLVVLHAPATPRPWDDQLGNWELGQFAGKQLFRGRTISRYTLRNDVAETLGVLLVADDGLVMLYCGFKGSFGHYWPGPLSFGEKGIKAFLAESEPAYVADKFTTNLPDGKVKRTAQHYIAELWPFAVVSIRKSMEVAP